MKKKKLRSKPEQPSLPKNVLSVLAERVSEQEARRIFLVQHQMPGGGRATVEFFDKAKAVAYFMQLDGDVVLGSRRR